MTKRSYKEADTFSTPPPPVQDYQHASEETEDFQSVGQDREEAQDQERYHQSGCFVVRYVKVGRNRITRTGKKSFVFWQSIKNKIEEFKGKMDVIKTT